jgi:hypothetical protein
MELRDFSEPARQKKAGAEVVTISFPSKIKIQTTGPGEQTLLDIAPPQGKQWQLLVRVDVEETDV